MVVYQALYGTFDVYVRPLSMFTSEVDHEKYPDVVQKYRFERVDLTSASDVNQPDGEQKEETTKEEHDGPNKNLLAFLDAETYYDKLEVLKTLKDKFTAEELLAICEIMDIGRADSEPEEKYYAVERYLELQIKYDGTRLR
jgi:response regulator of citrate/malate metabolism